MWLRYKPRDLAAGSTRVVEDDADRVPHAEADAANTVAEVHAVVALRALHGPVMHCEGHRITLPKRYDLDEKLRARLGRLNSLL